MTKKEKIAEVSLYRVSDGVYDYYTLDNDVSKDDKDDYTGSFSTVQKSPPEGENINPIYVLRRRRPSPVIPLPPAEYYAGFYDQSPEESTTTPSSQLKHRHSSWFFTFFILLIFSLIILWLYLLFTGKRPRDILKLLKHAGLHFKNRRRKRRRPHHRHYEELEESEPIYEKEAGGEIFSRPETEEEEGKPKAKKPHHHHRHKRPHQRSRNKTPFVEIHSSCGNTLKLEITTDAEDCVTTVEIDDEEGCAKGKKCYQYHYGDGGGGADPNSCGGEDVYVSEFDFDPSSCVENSPGGEDDDGSPNDYYYDVHGEDDEGDSISTTTSTSKASGSSGVRLDSQEERYISERYAGPNEHRSCRNNR